VLTKGCLDDLEEEKKSVFLKGKKGWIKGAIGLIVTSLKFGTRISLTPVVVGRR
jgi:hypothetical protein